MLILLAYYPRTKISWLEMAFFIEIFLISSNQTLAWYHTISSAVSTGIFCSATTTAIKLIAVSLLSSILFSLAIQEEWKRDRQIYSLFVEVGFNLWRQENYWHYSERKRWTIKHCQKEEREEECPSIVCKAWLLRRQKESISTICAQKSNT